MLFDTVEFTATVPGMRKGSHVWNLIVAVAYVVFAPVSIPLAYLLLTWRKNDADSGYPTGRSTN